MKAPASKSHGFSLIEVVVAVGIFAIAIVGVIGLLAPTAKSIGDVTDTAAATRLADGVASELARLRDSGSPRLGLDGLYQQIIAGNQPALPDEPNMTAYSFTALADGSYVVRDDKSLGLSNPANNNPVTGQPRGIAKNNRYFLIEVVPQPILQNGLPNPLAYIPSGSTGGPSGFLALTIIVKWPYYIGATPDTAQREITSSAQKITYAQSSMIYNIALTP